MKKFGLFFAWLSCVSAAFAATVVKDIAYLPPDVADDDAYATQRCRLDLYLPDEPKTGFPLMVWFHGGGLTGGSRRGDEPMLRRFADAGVAVASVDYRLSPRATYPGYIEDAARAVAWAAAEGPKRGMAPGALFVSGHSAGGYLAAMLAADARYLREAGAPPDAVAGYLPVSGQLVTHSTVRKERGLGRETVLSDEAAPLYHIGKHLPPILLLVADNDMAARLEETQLFVAAARGIAKNSRVSLLTVADRNHESIGKRLLAPDDPAGPAMLAFMKRYSPVPAKTPATFVYDRDVIEADWTPDAHWWVDPKGRYADYAKPRVAPSVTAPGYRGIWFALNQISKYGDKYSGGLGTYTSNHQPMAAYAPAVNKTFFTYGGAPSADQRELMIMVSAYDHALGVVQRPVALFVDYSVDDPHDNASLQLDREGHVWVFKSGRGIHRPGMIYRSAKPYDISAFEQVALQEFTYPQIWPGPGGEGFFLFFTKYVVGDFGRAERRVFWKTSADGRAWSEDRALAGFGGHYQTSGHWTGGGVTKYATFFNYHPKTDVDRRTNVYYAQTTDGGKTWTKADGSPISLPLTQRDNDALALDLEAEGKLMYSCDLNFDARGNPILLFIASRDGKPGPTGAPREWTVLHWTGREWSRSVVAVSTHNYDMGSLYVEKDLWRVIGPTREGPQTWGTGGEIESWVSRDEGKTWTKERVLTASSETNHGYARRPHNAHPDFAAFWADGDPTKLTPSRLYFSNADGSRVYRLPYDMPEGAEWVKPEIFPSAARNP